MALRKIISVEGQSFIQTEFGNIENGIGRATFLAYIKVVDVRGTKSQMTAKVSFDGDSQFFEKQYQVPVSVENGSPNFIEQVYKHLKTLPEFDGAENC